MHGARLQPIARAETCPAAAACCHGPGRLPLFAGSGPDVNDDDRQSDVLALPTEWSTLK